MTEKRFYRIGGHSIYIEFPAKTLSEKELLPYAPFRTDSYFGENLLFALTLIENPDALATKGSPIANLEDENGKTIVFAYEDGSLLILLTTCSGNECCRLHISNDYSSAEVWIEGATNDKRYALDTALMLLYTFASAKHDTLLLHASTVEYEGKGYLFLGKSGTGKSTHSRLWIENIPGTELLNDDNPILRIIDGNVYVYGSPWSGKTNCYRNRKIPAGGIVRLQQATVNRITPLTGINAYAALLPSCSCMKWNHEMAEAVHSTIIKVIERVPIYGLQCLPDKEAAILSHQYLIADKLIGRHSPGGLSSDGNE